jgi:ribonuclease D
MTAGQPGTVSRERYVQALGGLDPIESMHKAPKRLKKLLKDVSEKRLAARPLPGKWSIKEVVAHLADHEIVLGTRFRFVAALDRPPITGYDQDLFVERLGVDKTTTEDLLKDFTSVRKANVRLLQRLPLEARTRVGVHSERGEESLEDMIVMYAGHDLIHLAQIERMLAEMAEASKRQKRAKRAGKARSERLKPHKRNGKKAKAPVLGAPEAEVGMAEPAPAG